MATDVNGDAAEVRVPCPHCGTILIGHVRLRDNQEMAPAAGTSTICASCGEPSVVAQYNGHHYFRKPTTAEREAICSGPFWETVYGLWLTTGRGKERE